MRTKFLVYKKRNHEPPIIKQSLCFHLRLPCFLRLEMNFPFFLKKNLVSGCLFSVFHNLTAATANTASCQGQISIPAQNLGLEARVMNMNFVAKLASVRAVQVSRTTSRTKRALPAHGWLLKTKTTCFLSAPHELGLDTVGITKALSALPMMACRNALHVKDSAVIDCLSK